MTNDFQGLDFQPDFKGDKEETNIISIRANRDNLQGLKSLKAQHVNVSGWVNELISNGFKHTKRLTPPEISSKLKDFRPVELLVHKTVAVLFERALAFYGAYEVGKFLSVLLAHHPDFREGNAVAYGVSDEKFLKDMENLNFTLLDRERPRVE